MSASSDRTETTHFNIRYEDHSGDIFHPDDTLNGVVEFHVEKTIKAARGLKLTVTGIAKCSWKKGKTLKTPSSFKGSHTILNFVSNFFGREDGRAIEVSTGVHLYKFCVKIPPNSISSYEGTHGNVRYRISVVLDIPAGKDITYEKPFTVLRIENLNNMPWLRRKIEIEEEHPVGILCCESLPLVVSIRIPKSGYSLGETIKMKIEACNQGPSKFKNSKVSLERIEICNSQLPEQATVKTRKVVTYRSTKSLVQFESVFYEETLLIPEKIPVSSTENCDVFQITYQLKYTTHSTQSFINNKVEVFVPLTIAHIAYDSDNGDAKPTYDTQSTPIEDPRPKTKTSKAARSLPSAVPSV